MSITSILGTAVLAGVATATTHVAVEHARQVLVCENQGAVFYMHATQRLTDPNYTTFLGQELAKVRLQCRAAGGAIPAVVDLDHLPTRILDAAILPSVIETAVREIGR